MTVKELIEVLEHCNMDAEVNLIDCDNYNYTIETVEEVRKLWEEEVTTVNIRF